MERLEILKTYKIYIGGQFPRTESGRYYPLNDKKGKVIANICLSSKKDARNAVLAARKAFGPWSERTAFNRGQILYRIAEMLEGRREQFIAELQVQGKSKVEAVKELDFSIDRIVYYAGWADKYLQVLSSVNPVASSHFNFSSLEPTGVVGILAPKNSSLLGLVSLVMPVIVGGNTCVVLSSASMPLCAITFAEVLNSSDLPGGVVNILTGDVNETIGTLSSHMDINAIAFATTEQKISIVIENNAVLNIKRLRDFSSTVWELDESQNLHSIADFQEVKTTWHPIENIGGASSSY
ncbi:MAG: aldehyde dehydrogenase family protein [Bacteroidota bacterium]